MNNFLARWRAANRSPRFDKATGQKRKLWSLRDMRGVSAMVALALVVGSGLAVVSVSSAAEAHTPSIEVTCEGVTVTGLYYAASGSGEGQQNLIKFQLEGGKQQVIEFSKNGSHFFAFPNSTEAHTFTASVTAWNNPTHTSWNRTWTKTSEPCVAQSIVSVTAPRCEVPGGSTDITAEFKDLVANRTYEVTLSDSSGHSQTVKYTPKQTTGSYTWEGTAAGPTYTVTITDTTNRSLVACKTVHSVPCPEVAGIAILANECTVPGEGASLKVNVSDLVIGREYRIDIVNAASDAVVDSNTFTADATSGVYNSPATPSATYYATIVDTREADATPLKSNTHTFLPCPGEIGGLTLIATQCDVVSSDAAGEITFAVDGLVPGRTYNIVITDGSQQPVLSENNYVATTDRYDATLTGLAEGKYTATVTDAAQSEYTNSTTATLLPCATNETTVELAAEQCTVPGGDAAITATVSNYAAGRDYKVTLMLDNVAVDAQSLDSSSGTAQKFTFDGLEPDNTYRVVVTDTKSNPSVTAAADMYLDACPQMPAVLGSQVECTAGGDSSIEVTADNLFVGENYTVTVVTKSTGDAVEGVAPVTFEADMPTRTITIENVPNGDTYIVTVASSDMELVSQSEVTLEVCELPTLPLPPEEPPTTVPSSVDLPTLAYTGSSTIVPTLAGLGFLQLGLVLVGFSVARRRSVVRGN
ncbi:RTX toxin [Salinibacterium sp. NG253]|uniref:RTX toxin n=1 Tax=Salinibacterium sp. NG253 TaxID=2792039 RepID=UPI0018CDDF17|nr:RTX toxin [Salinibacterium sp. NG253]MBH0117341.1 RTX toxin [Salinibacterium sp. NG253]